MSAWLRFVEVAADGDYATVHRVHWPDSAPHDAYRHFRGLDPDKYRPHGDGGLIVDTIAGTTYITIHATEPPLGVDLPTPPAVVMDGQDPLIGDNT